DAVLVFRHAFGRGHLHEHQRERTRECFQRGDVGGGGQGVLVEGVGVFADAVGTVAFRVDGDEQHPRPCRLRQGDPLLLCLRKLRQRGGAHVRTMGEAEEHQGPVALQLAGHQRRAVGLLQAEGGQLARLLEQLPPLQRGGRRAGGRREPGRGGPQAETGGQRGDQDEEGGTVEHAGAFFSRYLNFGHDSRATVIIRGPAPPANSGPAMTDELHTIVDLIRYGASRFNAAGLTFGHSYDNALDEATQLTLHALHLPHDIGPAYGQARVTLAEKEEVLALFLR